MTVKLPLILATASAMALTACTDPGMTGANDSRTRQGALTGALIGGVIGGTRDDNKLEKAVVGAAVGAAVGGLIGNQLDKQAAELQRDIGDDRVRIVNTGNSLVVTMPQDILFATDSSSVRPDLQNDLYALADNLNRYPNTRVEVIGHTDNTGSAAYNQDLSQRRALAVAAVLRNGGVSPARVVAYGRGESEPIASNLTADGRMQNRRVEIIIRPTS